MLHGLEFLSASNEVAIGVAAFSSFSESDGSWCGFCARTAEGPLACLSGKKFKEAQEACHSLSEAEQENCLSSVNALKVLQLLGLDMSHWLYGFEGSQWEATWVLRSSMAVNLNRGPGGVCV